MAAANTIDSIVHAPTWDERIARLRQVPQKHGTNEHAGVYAEVARRLYVQHLAPDFAYVHEAPFYDLSYFLSAYEKASAETEGFTLTDPDRLAAVIKDDPTTLLVFRTITGLLTKEFAASTNLIAGPLGLPALSEAKVKSMERKGTRTSQTQALVAAQTLAAIMSGALFGEPPGGLKSKQSKPDTIQGWVTVSEMATQGVPYSYFLHQRHFGGAFGQVINATNTLRGNLIEDAVEELFKEHGVPHIRTGSQNQAEIEQRFEVTVRPAPDFVIFDGSDALRGMLECKLTNDGGTARDKALRFARLREESYRLNGIPLFAVLGGLGWTRVNDTLGPVIRDCDGRVFTLTTLREMLIVQPFPQLTGIAETAS